MNKIGVVLSGCGVYDGTEIHEAVLTLLAIDRAGAEAICIAPDMDQMHVINHLSGEETGERRNVLEESARIARGNVKNIAAVKAEDFYALVFPGGFGAAKNLCDFAVKGADCTIQPDVARLVKEMVGKKKPVGAACIAPALVAGIFKDDGSVNPSLTIGNDKDTAGAIEAMRSTHIDCPVREFTLDRENRIVSTPAYMLGTRISDVAEGIEKMVKAVIELI